MSIRKVIVGLLFILVAVALVLLMPRELDWALGENYDVSKIQDIQVRLDPVDGGESLSCTLNKGEDAYVKVLTLIQKPSYSRTFSKEEEGGLDYLVTLTLSNSVKSWDVVLDGGKQVALGAQDNAKLKTCQISGGQETQQEILDYLLTQAS